MAGSLVAVTNLDGSPSVFLTALSDKYAHFTTTPFELPQDKQISVASINFNDCMMAGIAASRNSNLKQGLALQIFDSLSQAGEEFIFRIQHDAELFVIAPVRYDILSSGGGGHFRIQVRDESPPDSDVILPDPLGNVSNDWRIKTGTAKAYELKKGQFVQIIDVEGQQCSDFMAMRSSSWVR